MQLRDLLTRATERLSSAGISSPEPDARCLLEHALNLNRTAFLLRGGEEVAPDAEARAWEMIEQRAARVPLQHLIGEVEWGGVRLKSDPRALVPRPETEWLLHLALEELRQIERPRVLDVGTGSGALALGLKAAFPHAEVTATDLSPGALSLALENAALNGLDVTFVGGSLLAGLSGPFDLIVSNPPYLPSADRTTADPEVRHDPELALYAGEDGLDVARPLVAAAAAALVPGGALLLELDPRNAPTLAAEVQGAGWQAEVLPDLTGRERFVRARRAERRVER